MCDRVRATFAEPEPRAAVIPAKAGIQTFHRGLLNSGFRRNDVVGVCVALLQG